MKLLSGFKFWRCLVMFARKILNIKTGNMAYDGTEGSIVNEQDFSDYRQNYDNTFSQEPTYTKFEVIGKSFIEESIFIQDCVAVRIYNVIGTHGQTGVVLVPVDRNGNELPLDTNAASRGGGDGKGGSGGPRCPNTCP